MLIFNDISQVVRREEENERGYSSVYVDEDNGGDIDENTRLMNQKREGNFKASGLTAIISDSEEEFLVPKSIEDKYISSGILTERPEDSWKTKNWFVLDISESAGLVRDKFVVREKFNFHHKDEPLVRLAKRIINDELDKRGSLVFDVKSTSDKRRIRERFKEIKKNELSSKQFFKLMESMAINVDITAWTADVGRSEGFSEKII
jgi:hypothetical protein